MVCNFKVQSVRGDHSDTALYRSLPRTRSCSRLSLPQPAARAPPGLPAVPAGTPASRDENPAAAGPEEADAILAAPSPSAASLPFNPAPPFLGIESSPRLFTEPAFCGLLTGVVQAPGPAQDRTTCPAWRTAPELLSAKATFSQMAGTREPAAGALRLRSHTLRANPGSGRPPQHAPSRAAPATACLSPTPPPRSGWAAKEIPVLRLRPTFSRLHPSLQGRNKPIRRWHLGHVTDTSHPEESTRGRSCADGGSIGQHRFVSLTVFRYACCEFWWTRKGWVLQMTALERIQATALGSSPRYCKTSQPPRILPAFII